MDTSSSQDEHMLSLVQTPSTHPDAHEVIHQPSQAPSSEIGTPRVPHQVTSFEQTNLSEVILPPHSQVTSTFSADDITNQLSTSKPPLLPSLHMDVSQEKIPHDEQPVVAEPYYLPLFINYVRALYKAWNYVDIKWPLFTANEFINLSIVAEDTIPLKEKECTELLVLHGNVDEILCRKMPIQLDEIAKDVPERSIILVEGAPGVGKSTLAWEFCRRWERGEIAQQYQLVLLLRLRDERMRRAKCLEDLIYHPSKYVTSAMKQKMMASFGRGTLLILEGFDELPDFQRKESSIFLQLVFFQLLPLATILVTSRPCATSILLTKCRVFQHIKILGFTESSIKEYIASFFMRKKHSAVESEIRDEYDEFLSYLTTNPQIRECMYSPLLSAIIVNVFREHKAGGRNLPNTQTELYYALTRTLLVRYLFGHPEYSKQRWSIISLEKDLPRSVFSRLQTLCGVAFRGICSDSVKVIFHDLPPDFESLGFLQSVPQMYVSRGEIISHNFLHLTIQEFLAALHISFMPSEEQIKILKRYEDDRFQVVLRFVAGITKFTNIPLDGIVTLFCNPITKVKPSNIDSSSILCDMIIETHRVQWMFESQSSILITSVLENKVVESSMVLPMDYYCLGYCIFNSQCQWVLTMKDEIGDEEIMMLMAGASTGPDETSANLISLRGGEDNGKGCYLPLSISAKSLSMIFNNWKKIIHLQELILQLPVECSAISWPDLTGLQVLHLGISGKRDWRLDTLYSSPSHIRSLTIEITDNQAMVGHNDCQAIGELISYSEYLQELCFLTNVLSITDSMQVTNEGIESIMQAITNNQKLPLRSIVVKCKCTFTDTAAHSLAQFIRNSTTIQTLSMQGCVFSVHGLLELVQATHHSSCLLKRKLEYLHCRIDEDYHVAEFAQLMKDYRNVVGMIEYSFSIMSENVIEVIAISLKENCILQKINLYNNSITDAQVLQLAEAINDNCTLKSLNLSNSSINDTGAEALAAALHHNSTLEKLNLSHNVISDAGATNLAQALHHNSTLVILDLSCNDKVGNKGLYQLAEALMVNSSIGCGGLILSKSSEEYVTHYPQYDAIKVRIAFEAQNESIDVSESHEVVELSYDEKSVSKILSHPLSSVTRIDVSEGQRVVEFTERSSYDEKTYSKILSHPLSSVTKASSIVEDSTAVEPIAEDSLFLFARDGNIEAFEQAILQPMIGVNSDGDAPLHIACKHGHFSIAKAITDKLVAAHALEDLRVKNKSGFEPIHLAYRENYKEIAFYISQQYYKHRYPMISFQGPPFMDTVDSRGRFLSWENYGVLINVPAGAVCEGTEILVQVHCTVGGPFILPDGYRLVSPLYFVSPTYEFEKDVELSIVHHASLTTRQQCSQLQFVTCDTLQHLDQQKYPLQKIREGGRFMVSGVIGRISVRHFCPNGVAADESSEPIQDTYRLVHYSPSTPSSGLARSVFSVSLFVPPYRQGSLQQYLNKIFEVQFWPTCKIVRLDQEKVSLQLPVEDAKVQGYDLQTDIVPSEITKHDIDWPKRMNSPGTAPDPGDVEYMDEFYPPRILLTCQKVGPQLQQTLRTEVKVLEGDREEIWKFLLQVILQHVSTPMTKRQHLQLGHGATDVDLCENIFKTPDYTRSQTPFESPAEYAVRKKMVEYKASIFRHHEYAQPQSESDTSDSDKEPKPKRPRLSLDVQVESPTEYAVRKNLELLIGAVERNLGDIVLRLQQEEEPFITAKQAKVTGVLGMSDEDKAKKLVECYIVPKIKGEEGEKWFEKLVNILANLMVEKQLVEKLIKDLLKKMPDYRGDLRRHLPAQQPTPVQSQPREDSELSSRVLLQEVVDDVKDKWYNLGILLTLNHRLLNDIEKDYKNEERCCIIMFGEWLVQNMDASWSKLVDALRDKAVKKNELANRLETKYVTQ